MPPKRKLELKDIVPFYVTDMMNPPEWIQLLNEEELKDEVKPDAVLWQLRIRLWSLIELKLQNQAANIAIDPIEISDIFKDICSKSMFLNRIRDDRKGAFVCRPIYDFQHQLDALLTVGASRLWEIMTLPIKDKKGVMDPKAVGLVLQAFKMLKDTKYGGPVQRVVTAKVGADDPILNKKPILVEEEIKLLEHKLKHGKVVEIGE